MTNALDGWLWELSGQWVFNSIWLSLPVAVIYGIFMLFSAKLSAGFRYGLSILAIVVLTIGSMIATSISWQQKTTSQTVAIQESSQEVDLAFLLNSTGATTFYQQQYEWLFQAANKYQSPIGLAWCIGILILSARFAGGFIYLSRLRKSSVPIADLQVQQHFSLLTTQLQINKTVTLLESKLVGVPMTIGYWQPVVILPLSIISTIPAAQLEAILLHELSHIQQNDYLINLAVSLAEIIFFFHPLMWWLSRNVKETREHRCDDIAIKISQNPYALAKALTFFQENNFTNSNTLAMTLKPKNSVLSRRIIRLFGKRSDAYTAKGIAGFVIILLLSTAFTFIKPLQDSPILNAPEAPLADTLKLEAPERPEKPAVPEEPVAPEIPDAVEVPDAPQVPDSIKQASPEIVPQTPEIVNDTIPKETRKQQVKIRTEQTNTPEEQPMYIIDGKVVSQEKVGELNPEEIDRIDVLKDDKAIEKYGDEGVNGVVEITTNDASASVSGAASKVEIRSTTGMSQSEEQPLFFIDGKKVSYEEVGELNPNEIDKINVLKEKTAIEAYGSEGSNGVIEITTKNATTILRGKATKTDEITSSNKGNLVFSGFGEDGKEPLIVIDGEVQGKKSTKSLNIASENVHRFEILKGDAAIDAYGVEGKDGVIIITTKEHAGKE